MIKTRTGPGVVFRFLGFDDFDDVIGKPLAPIFSSKKKKLIISKPTQHNISTTTSRIEAEIRSTMSSVTEQRCGNFGLIGTPAAAAACENDQRCGVFNMHDLRIVQLNNAGASSMDDMDLTCASDSLQKSLDEVVRIAPSLATFSSQLSDVLRSKGPISSTQPARMENLYDEGMYCFSDPIRIERYNSFSLQYSVAVVFYNLGQLCLRLNSDEQAASFFCQALAILSGAGDGCDDPNRSLNMVTILHNIGYVDYRIGKFEEAAETFQKTLDLQKLSVKYNPRDMLAVASTMNCLGVIFFHKAIPEMDRALTLFEDSLALHRALLGPEWECKEVATILNNIGRVHFSQEKYAMALTKYRESLNLRRQILGNGHLDVAACLYNIGHAHQQEGDLSDAMERYNEFLSIAKKHLGQKHRDIAIVLKGVAQIHHERHEYKLAKACYNEALDVARCCLGEHHAEVAVILNKFGNLLYETGELSDAIQVYREGLEVERLVLEPCHPNIVVTLNNIARILKHRGDYSSALQLYKEALVIQRNNLNDVHPVIATTLSSMALILYQTQKYTKSLNLYQEVLRIQWDIYGDKNLEVASTLNSIGLVLFKMGLNEFALQSFQRCLEIRRDLQGPSHREVAVILFNIATAHFDSGDEDEAMHYYYETIKVERAVLGPEHQRDLLLTVQHVGVVHQNRGELKEALDLFREALDIQLEFSRQDSASISQTLNCIGNVHLQRGDAGNAVVAFSEALRLLRSDGKSDVDLTIDGFSLYGLSKLHPECAPVA